VAEAYCVKCKAKKEIANAQEVTMKNGKPAIQGTCPDCGTKLFRIGAKK
jgi:RNase P subunit RPR2